MPTSKPLMTVFCLLVYLVGHGQTNLGNTKSYHVGDNLHLFSSIDLAPDGKTLAVATVQGYPLYLFDVESKTITKKIDVDGYYAGPIVKYSETGKYILLEQQFYHDWKINKAKAVKYEVVDVALGEIIFSKKDLQDAAISPDENKLAVIRKDMIEYYTLPAGKLQKSYPVKGIKNSLCFSEDGSKLYISHQFTKDMLKDFPRLKQDKKARKAALKYQHTVSEFDAATLKRLRSFPEVFDHVYEMSLNYDATKIYVMSKQSSKIGGNAYNAYILIFDIGSGTIERGGYTTNVLMGDYGESGDGTYFGIVNNGGEMLPNIQVCDASTADILTLFKFNKGWFEGFSKKEFQGGQVSFDFTDDGKTLFVSMGNMIYEWDINF